MINEVAMRVVEHLKTTQKFKPLSAKELIEILGLTIKRDEENKLITFLGQLSAYTDEAQMNLSFNAPSSTGKSYIPAEIAKLFPEEDVLEIGYCSPTAFFHETGKFNKEKKRYEIDLRRKILIFLDQPHTMLLERLRPLLSHDKKEMHLKITDKQRGGGNRTKNVCILGYPVVVFCSAGMKIDEQESTRFILLSPETSQEKIREAIQERIKKETDNSEYDLWLNQNSERLFLKKRIEAIKNENIKDIKIKDYKIIEELYLDRKERLLPRHQRDIGKVISLIKSFALLNLWFRKREGNLIYANDDDIAEAIMVWEKIAEGQEFNVPPYVYNLFKDVILSAWNEKQSSTISEKIGLARQEIIKKHYEVYGRILPDWQLRQQLIPMLDTAGLITQEPDPSDKRKILIYPTPQLTK